MTDPKQTPEPISLYDSKDSPSQIMPCVLSRIENEREEQCIKWGDESEHHDLYWLAILSEEVL